MAHLASKVLARIQTKLNSKLGPSVAISTRQAPMQGDGTIYHQRMKTWAFVAKFWVSRALLVELKKLTNLPVGSVEQGLIA